MAADCSVMDSPSGSTSKGILCIIASAFGFAVMALMVGLCDHYGPAISCFQKAFFRNLPAVLIAAYVFSTSTPLHGHLNKKSFWLLFIRSAIGCAGIFANFYALSKIPIGEGMTLNKTAPFFTVLLSWLFLKERLTLRQFICLTAAFIGAMLIIKPEFSSVLSPLSCGRAGSPLPAAHLLALAGGLCAGTAYVCVHRLGQMRVPGAFIVLVFSAFSCLASIPFILFDYTPMTFAQWLILIGAGAGGAIGQFGITAAYRYAEPRKIAPFDYTNVIFTCLMGYFFLGQTIDSLSLLGIAVIILSALAK